MQQVQPETEQETQQRERYSSKQQNEAAEGGGKQRRGREKGKNKPRWSSRTLQTETKVLQELFGEPGLTDARGYHWLLPARAAQQRAQGRRLPARMRAPCSTPPLQAHSKA